MGGTGFLPPRGGYNSTGYMAALMDVCSVHMIKEKEKIPNIDKRVADHCKVASHYPIPTR